MNCGGCKHWKPITDHLDDDMELVTGWGTCGRIRMMIDKESRGSGYGRNRMELGEDLALAEDGSGFRAALISREAFGCVLYEAKREP